VQAASGPIAATITPQHLMFNRNDMLVGGIRPHFFCLPILKRNIHQSALVAAATSGSAKFFLGTDSAPHATNKKEAACGCAGCYSAFSALELYTTVFEQAGALDKLEAFASFYGPDFYGLARNTDTVTLVKKDWQLPTTLPFAGTDITPLLAGDTLPWQIQAG
jgi:dihydroorotase